MNAKRFWLGYLASERPGFSHDGQVTIARSDMVAISAGRNNPEKDLFQTVVHLRGGSSLEVTEAFLGFNDWFERSEM